MKEQLKRFGILFFGLGFIYALVELFFTAIIGLLIDKSMSLIGHTSLWMILVGGTMGVILGGFDEIRWFTQKINMFWQSIIGMIAIFIIEFLSGLVLNVHFQLGIWDYSNLWFNVMGQITLVFAPLWFLICPFAFWIDDHLKCKYFDMIEPSNVWKYYRLCFRPLNKIGFTK
jgi:uncharacterized membrane protein